MAQQECPEGVVSYSVLPVDGGDGGGDGVRLHEPSVFFLELATRSLVLAH